MKIVFTRHVKHRMKWRKITEAEVKETLANPDRTETYQLDPRVINVFKQMGKRYLRVSYRKENNTLVIISAVDKNN